MGSYYLSILMQLSMNLTNEHREAFTNLLDKYNYEFVFYTFDLFFVISSFLGAALLYLNWIINKSTQ